MSRHRIGIDVGGTFTDFVMADLSSAAIRYHKEPSVPADPSEAVERGVAALLEMSGADPGTIELVVHGTTLAVNAIIQGRGAAVALVVSRGNRDVMEIARARMPNSYDFTAGRETPLIPREAVFEIEARGLADGTVLRDADPEEIAAVAAAIRAGRFDAVAVMLLNSYRDGTLERRVAGLLRAELPELLITASADIWPEMREYERALVAAMNAYLHPLMKAYFDRLEQRLAGLGVHAPIHITANNGGTVSLETARARPIDTVLSGPASGVLAATRTSAAHPAIVTFDMGGTSTDIAVSQSGGLEFSHSTQIGDFPLMLPVVNVSAIGAGGGSIVWVDRQGVLKVGPESAGASPGPVCYGQGGTRPTITDAYLTLGCLNPARFLDGRMRLDVEAADLALGDIARQLGVADAVEAASAAIRVATAKMATELTKLLAQQGLEPHRFVLVSYGGAGPTHANLLAEEARLDAVLVPRAPGTFCALGAILADVRRDYVRPARHMIGRDPAGFARIVAALADVEEEARNWVAREGELIGDHHFRLSADMRYPAQAFELNIRVSDYDRASLTAAQMIDAFNEEHQRLYGFHEPDSEVQVTNLRLGVVGRVAPVRLPAATPGPPPLPIGQRRVFHQHWQQLSVYDRADIGADAVIEGPAIVEQPDSTVWILPDWRARADQLGNLLIRRR